MWKSEPSLARRTRLLSTIIGLLIPGAVGASDPEPLPQERLREPLKVLTSSRFEGVGSCSASACHNGRVARDGLPGSEHSIWVTRDRHATAYTVLLGERSRRIERNFRRDRAIRAERDALCLNCHSHMDFESSLHDRAFDVADGVGCESCHGAAGRWLAPHTTAGWKFLAEEQKAAYGFYPTDDLVSRVRMCAECHVGTTRRTSGGELIEVNHDLIASGHPRLAFEYSAYLGIEPKHWLTIEERARTPDLEARSYAAGQLVALQSALDLLAERSQSAAAERESSKGKQPWPELTEYGCFACHHALDDPSKTQARGYPNRRPGTLPWGSWFTPTLESLYDTVGPGTPTLLLPTVAGLSDLMSSPYPEPREVSTLATEASSMIESWLRDLQTRPIAPTTQRELMIFLASRGAKSPQDWDAAVQTYLGLAALHQASGGATVGSREDALRAAFRAMTDRLRFPPGTDSPGADTQGNPVREELLRIQALLSQEEPRP